MCMVAPDQSSHWRSRSERLLPTLSAYEHCLDDGLANQHHDDQWPIIPKLTLVSLAHLFKNWTVSRLTSPKLKIMHAEK